MRAMTRVVSRFLIVGLVLCLIVGSAGTSHAGEGHLSDRIFADYYSSSFRINSVLSLSDYAVGVVSSDSVRSPVDNRSWRKGILRDLGYAGRTAVGDLAHVYTAPARLNSRSAMWVGGILAVGGVIFIYDQEIYDAFKRSQDDPLYKPIRKLGENFTELGYMGTTNRFYLGGMLLGYATGIKPLFQISAEILESQLIAGVAKDAANITMGRRRPFENEGARSFKFNDGTSFPSGHAKNVMAAASIISNHIDFLPVQIAAYGIAGSVCLERVTSDGHWPSDVYFASIYGWLVAETVFKRHLGSRTEIAPVSGNGTAGLMLSYRL